MENLKKKMDVGKDHFAFHHAPAYVIDPKKMVNLFV